MIFRLKLHSSISQRSDGAESSVKSGTTKPLKPLNCSTVFSGFHQVQRFLVQRLFRPAVRPAENFWDLWCQNLECMNKNEHVERDFRRKNKNKTAKRLEFPQINSLKYVLWNLGSWNHLSKPLNCFLEPLNCSKNHGTMFQNRWTAFENRWTVPKTMETCFKTVELLSRTVELFQNHGKMFQNRWTASENRWTDPANRWTVIENRSNASENRWTESRKRWTDSENHWTASKNR